MAYTTSHRGCEPQCNHRIVPQRATSSRCGLSGLSRRRIARKVSPARSASWVQAAAGCHRCANIAAQAECDRALSSHVPDHAAVRQLREALGLTPAELVARAGIRRATVNRIENAHVTAIDLEVLEKLAGALHVEPGFLLVRAPALAGSKSRAPKRPPTWR